MCAAPSHVWPFLEKEPLIVKLRSSGIESSPAQLSYLPINGSRKKIQSPLSSHQLINLNPGEYFQNLKAEMKKWRAIMSAKQVENQRYT